MRPQELLEALVRAAPDFEAQLKAPSLFMRADGSFTLHGLFAEFSHFFRAAHESLSDRDLTPIGALISSCMRDPRSELDNATATCFIENITEGPAGDRLSRYLTGNALAYLNACRGE